MVHQRPRCVAGSNGRPQPRGQLPLALRPVRVSALHTAALIASGHLASGDLVRPAATSRVHLPPNRAPPHLITFDGSWVAHGPQAAGGAAAILWGPPSASGPRRRVAAATAHIPGCASAEEAEARAGALAIELWRQHSRGQMTRLAGDRRGVVRYCAGTARTRSSAMALILEEPLRLAAAAGPEVSWGLLPRARNQEADALARRAARAGAGLDHSGGQPQPPAPRP